MEEEMCKLKYGDHWQDREALVTRVIELNVAQVRFPSAYKAVTALNKWENVCRTSSGELERDSNKKVAVLKSGRS